MAAFPPLVSSFSNEIGAVEKFVSITFELRGMPRCDIATRPRVGERCCGTWYCTSSIANRIFASLLHAANQMRATGG